VPARAATDLAPGACRRLEQDVRGVLAPGRRHFEPTQRFSAFRLHARSCLAIEAMRVLVPYFLRVEGLGAERNVTRVAGVARPRGVGLPQSQGIGLTFDVGGAPECTSREGHAKR